MVAESRRGVPAVSQYEGLQTVVGGAEELIQRIIDIIAGELRDLCEEKLRPGDTPDLTEFIPLACRAEACKPALLGLVL